MATQQERARRAEAAALLIHRFPPPVLDWLVEYAAPLIEAAPDAEDADIIAQLPPVPAELRQAMAEWRKTRASR